MVPALAGFSASSASRPSHRALPQGQALPGSAAASLPRTAPVEIRRVPAKEPGRRAIGSFRSANAISSPSESCKRKPRRAGQRRRSPAAEQTGGRQPQWITSHCFGPSEFFQSATTTATATSATAVHTKVVYCVPSPRRPSPAPPAHRYAGAAPSQSRDVVLCRATPLRGRLSRPSHRHLPRPKVSNPAAPLPPSVLPYKSSWVDGGLDPATCSRPRNDAPSRAAPSRKESGNQARSSSSSRPCIMAPRACAHFQAETIP